uniref:uncharacterized protein LOC122597886 isoform X2 n=1 Tax=Erigeron canadensis TaxID=72917 RepID=UPI001CB8B1F9|nr:uncharacterized protein LOC122597886 isoform X2 [Erigeron canadensis]
MERREARRQCLEVSHCNPFDPSLPPFEINRRPLIPDLILTREQLARAYRPKYVVFNGKKIPAGTVANYINHRPPCFPLKPRGDSTGKDLSLSPPATATGTNAEVGGGSKGPAADPSEPVGIKAEGMHNYPLKSQPSTESLVIDLNSKPCTSRNCFYCWHQS